MSAPVRAELAILGGSGLYELAGLDDPVAIEMETPFGTPSDGVIVGRLSGRRVAFLARHGRRHTRLPGEVPYRANVYAMKMLGVERILSASAVGSLRESIRPRDVVVPDQFVDWTRNRKATFFGEGVVAHVSLADPFCPQLSGALVDAARRCGGTVHPGGTYLCMEGPAFSTRAESRLYRAWGMDVIGMTNATEAKLAREAGICYGSLSLVTDYDCWHEEEGTVNVEMLLEHLRANARLAAESIRTCVESIPPRGAGCGCADALRDAVVTPRDAIPEETRSRLAALLGEPEAS